MSSSSTQLQRSNSRRSISSSSSGVQSSAASRLEREAAAVEDVDVQLTGNGNSSSSSNSRHKSSDEGRPMPRGVYPQQETQKVLVGNHGAGAAAAAARSQKGVGEHWDPQPPPGLPPRGNGRGLWRMLPPIPQSPNQDVMEPNTNAKHVQIVQDLASLRSKPPQRPVPQVPSHPQAREAWYRVNQTVAEDSTVEREQPEPTARRDQGEQEAAVPWAKKTSMAERFKEVVNSLHKRGKRADKQAMARRLREGWVPNVDMEIKEPDPDPDVRRQSSQIVF